MGQADLGTIGHDLKWLVISTGPWGGEWFLIDPTQENKSLIDEAFDCLQRLRGEVTVHTADTTVQLLVERIQELREAGEGEPLQTPEDFGSDVETIRTHLGLG